MASSYSLNLSLTAAILRTHGTSTARTLQHNKQHFFIIIIYILLQFLLIILCATRGISQTGDVLTTFLVLSSGDGKGSFLVKFVAGFLDVCYDFQDFREVALEIPTIYKI